MNQERGGERSTLPIARTTDTHATRLTYRWDTHPCVDSISLDSQLPGQPRPVTEPSAMAGVYLEMRPQCRFCGYVPEIQTGVVATIQVSMLQHYSGSSCRGRGTTAWLILINRIRDQLSNLEGAVSRSARIPGIH
jgi:hypothetical protein